MQCLLVARTLQVRALACLIESNPDMWPVVLDQCYSESQPVAIGYLQVLVEVYCLQGLACPTPPLLAVVLFILVHERKARVGVDFSLTFR